MRGAAAIKWNALTPHSVVNPSRSAKGSELGTLEGPKSERLATVA